MMAALPRKIQQWLLVWMIIFPFFSIAQGGSVNPRWLHGFWQAKWIAGSRMAGMDFGVFHFRKSFELGSTPANFIIHISADNRYRLFVNGHSICTGPARSDLSNWNFETVDIAPYLRQGKNVLAATVWNFGEFRPYSQISFQTALIVQGDSEAEKIVNTDHSWKVQKDSSYSPLPIDRSKLQTYIVTAEGERVDGNHYAWGFEEPGFDDAAWPDAVALWYPAKTRGFGTDGNWMLVPRSIPLAEEKPERLGEVRRSEGITVSNDFLKGNSPVMVPANSKVSILLDQSHLTNAYPKLLVSGGKGASITLIYAEALVDSLKNKGNRNEIENKTILGIEDQYIADGAKDRWYSPLFFRTFRYLQLNISTGGEPLQLKDIYGIFTGYPFEEKAYFKTGRNDLDKIWEVGWRTARLCAVDTYFDCPYYEQLQYVGDTRIQALISLYVAGDDRLMRKAIEDLSHSFIPDGLTQSRYPSRDLQVIPTFSLWWICMIHDYWMHRKDDVFVQSHLEGVERILKWYQKRIAMNGMLGSLQWWQFEDWSWPHVDSIRIGGVPPGASKGGSSIITLQYAYTLQRAAQLMDAYGMNTLAGQYSAEALSITSKTFKLCWDAKKGLLADTYEKNEFSQHANIMAILTNAIPAIDQRAVVERLLSDSSITQCTYYFRFYLFEALKKVKLGDRYLALLKPWQNMIARGLTTFAENPEPVRSDCHAWSASPLYQFLSTVCGVIPASPGFQQVKIEPFFGDLEKVQGRIPHPKGFIEVNLEKKAGHISGQVVLPEGITGTLLWANKKIPLKGGKQNVSL